MYPCGTPPCRLQILGRFLDSRNDDINKIADGEKLKSVYIKLKLCIKYHIQPNKIILKNPAKLAMSQTYYQNSILCHRSP